MWTAWPLAVEIMIAINTLCRAKITRKKQMVPMASCSDMLEIQLCHYGTTWRRLAIFHQSSAKPHFQLQSSAL